MPDADSGEAPRPIDGGDVAAAGQNLLMTKRPLAVRVLDRLAPAIKRVRVEIFIGLLTVTLSLGQYFYSSINTRMTIANIWRDGYKSEVRDRVTKFRYHYRRWRKIYEKDRSTPNPDWTVERLADTNLLFSEDCPISGDKYLVELISDEVAPAAREHPTNEDYVRAALVYRNAIIECLNTMEVVKAVIESRPLPFFKYIFYSGTLAGRYKDVILETRTDLMSFIDLYRQLPQKYGQKKRETEAWFVLTDEESYAYDYIFAGVLFLMLILILVLVSWLKKYYGAVNQPQPLTSPDSPAGQTSG
jgi:hypothetical protein